MNEPEELSRVYYHSEHTECMTYFMIRGNFDPDEITAYLRVVPEQVQRIGDPIGKSGRKRQAALWRYGTVVSNDWDVDKMMKETIRALLPKEDLLRKIKLTYDAALTLEVVPLVRYDEQPPCLAPSLAVMRFCLETGTEMDIDLYVCCPDDMVE